MTHVHNSLQGDAISTWRLIVHLRFGMFVTLPESSGDRVDALIGYPHSVYAGECGY